MSPPPPVHLRITCPLPVTSHSSRLHRRLAWTHSRIFIFLFSISLSIALHPENTESSQAPVKIHFIVQRTNSSHVLLRPPLFLRVQRTKSSHCLRFSRDHRCTASVSSPHHFFMIHQFFPFLRSVKR